jgi:hypothetical protein
VEWLYLKAIGGSLTYVEIKSKFVPLHAMEGEEV